MNSQSSAVNGVYRDNINLIKSYIWLQYNEWAEKKPLMSLYGTPFRGLQGLYLDDFLIVDGLAPLS